MWYTYLWPSVLGRAYLLTSRGKGTRAAGNNFIGEGRV
jgi:hypothetical protein